MPSDIFSALADSTRRKILEMLADHDGFAASDIHNQFQSSPQAISQHLKILREANLVHVEKKAQQRIYRINTEAIVEFENWAYSMRRRWSSRLDTLDKVLKETYPMTTIPEKQDIVITREFNYPVELVWNAWTDPTLVVKWWGPAHYTSPRCKNDFREGGKYVFCMRAPESHGGLESYSAGTYRKIVPLERLEFNQYLSDQDGNAIDPVLAGVPADFPLNVEFVIEFIAKGERTELKITEYGWTVGQMMRYAIMGMNQSLDKLEGSLVKL